MIGILIWEGALKKAFVRCLCLHPMLLKMELGSELMSTGSDGFDLSVAVAVDAGVGLAVRTFCDFWLVVE